MKTKAPWKSGPLGMFILACLVLGLGAIGCSSVPQNKEDASATQQMVESSGQMGTAERPLEMLIMMLKLTSEGVEQIEATRAPNSLNRRDPNRRESTFVRILDEDGEMLAELGFKLGVEITGEAPDENGELSGTHIPIEEPVFVVKVPAFENIGAIQLFRVNPGQTRQSAELLGEVRP